MRPAVGFEPERSQDMGNCALIVGLQDRGLLFLLALGRASVHEHGSHLQQHYNQPLHSTSCRNDGAAHLYEGCIRFSKTSPPFTVYYYLLGVLKLST